MGPTVLVVEGDLDSRELLGELLELSGFRPVLATDGLDALEILATERPCLILLDLMMPRMNGWAFREAQLTTQRLHDIPAVVVSADGNVAAKAAQVRAAAFVRTPSDPEELLRVVAAQCNGLMP